MNGNVSASFGGMEHCVMNVSFSKSKLILTFIKTELYLILIVSDSGQQVIALGVMVGILIIIFYGVLLFRSIRKKRKLLKIDQK